MCSGTPIYVMEEILAVRNPSLHDVKVLNPFAKTYISCLGVIVTSNKTKPRHSYINVDAIAKLNMYACMFAFPHLSLQRLRDCVLQYTV